jgi:hypothetical protein
MAASVMDRLIAEHKAMKKALIAIANLGTTCDDYGLCKHPACEASVGACLTAINTLTELGMRKDFPLDRVPPEPKA